MTTPYPAPTWPLMAKPKGLNLEPQALLSYQVA